MLKTIFISVFLLSCSFPSLGQDINVSAGKATYPERGISINGKPAKRGIKFDLDFKVEGDAALHIPFFDWDEKSGLTVKDSKGGNLGKATVFMSSSMGEDAKNLTIFYFVDKLPEDGMEWIQLKGKATVSVLQTRTLTEPVSFDVKSGSKFRVGGMSFEITKVDGSQIELTIKGKQMPVPYEFVFTDQDGKKLKPRQNMSSSTLINNKSTVTRTYKFKESYDQLNLAVSSWQKDSKKELPVDMKIDLSKVEK